MKDKEKELIIHPRLSISKNVSGLRVAFDDGEPKGFTYIDRQEALRLVKFIMENIDLD